MITILSFLGVLVFYAGAYFIGNAVFKTFYDNWQEQLRSSLYGILLWAGIGMVVLICVGIYIGVRTLLLNTL